MKPSELSLQTLKSFGSVHVCCKHSVTQVRNLKKVSVKYLLSTFMLQREKPPSNHFLVSVQPDRFIGWSRSGPVQPSEWSGSTGRRIDYNVWGNQVVRRIGRRVGDYPAPHWDSAQPGDIGDKGLCNSCYTVSPTTITSTPGTLTGPLTTISPHAPPEARSFITQNQP